MQATGHLVAAAAELAAGVQLGEHELDGADALGGVHVGGDAAAVVLDPDRAVLHERDVDGVGVAGERLVDRVVDDLPHEVVQAALAGGADVHAGALAHRLEALEHGDRAGVVGRLAHRRGPGPRPGPRVGGTAAASRVCVGGLVGLLVRHGSPSSAGPTGPPAGLMARARGENALGAGSAPILPVGPSGPAPGRPVWALFRLERGSPDPRHAPRPFRSPDSASPDAVPRLPRLRRVRVTGPGGRPAPTRPGRTRPAAAPAGSGRSPAIRRRRGARPAAPAPGRPGRAGVPVPCRAGAARPRGSSRPARRGPSRG